MFGFRKQHADGHCEFQESILHQEQNGRRGRQRLCERSDVVDCLKLDRMRIGKNGGETFSLVNPDIAVVANEQDGTGKYLRVNSFKEDARNRIVLIHKLREC